LGDDRGHGGPSSLAPPFRRSHHSGGPTPSPPGAKVEFIDIKDGRRHRAKTTIHFGLHGMGVAPAGTKRPNRVTIIS
jgi:hypothetical protein